MSMESAKDRADLGGYVKKLLVLAGATLLMAACSDTMTSPSSPQKAAPDKARFDEEFGCRSGYVVAYDENGNPYCAPEPDAQGLGVAVVPDSTSGH
jgi:hypothetical protein